MNFHCHSLQEAIHKHLNSFHKRWQLTCTTNGNTYRQNKEDEKKAVKWNSHHHAYCIIYTDLRVYLINWSAVITEQCKKNYHFQSHTSHGILKSQLSTYCVLPAQYKVQHFSLHTLLPAQYELWHSQVQLLIYSAFSSIQDVAYSTTVLHILSASTFPYTIQATFVCSSHISSSFMFIKDKFFLANFATPIPKTEYFINQ